MLKEETEETEEIVMTEKEIKAWKLCYMSSTNMERKIKEDLNQDLPLSTNRTGQSHFIPILAKIALTRGMIKKIFLGSYGEYHRWVLCYEGTIADGHVGLETTQRRSREHHGQIH